ncbi:MAG: Gfo/Idh/MocA family protein [Armatimonadota bacterium]
MNTIHWGIIGCGNVTEVKSGPGFQQAEGSALVAVMRRDGEKARDYAQRHGVPRWYDDAEKLIHDPEVDAVYVATPPSTHAEYTIRAAQAGKPVYVEKPMARDAGECRRMIAACKQAGVPLFVAYYRRALPRFLKVKDLLEAGAIGTPRFVTVTQYYAPGDYDPAHLPWRVVPEIAGAGIFLDLASHTLDILDFLLGPVAEAKGMAQNQAGLYPAEDCVAAALTFESGALGTGLWCFTAYNEDAVDTNEIVGSKGKLRFSTFGTEPIELATADGVSLHPAPTPPHIQQPLIQTIVNDLNGIGSCPSTGDTATRTSEVMDAILRDWRVKAEAESN